MDGERNRVNPFGNKRMKDHVNILHKLGTTTHNSTQNEITGPNETSRRNALNSTPGNNLFNSVETMPNSLSIEIYPEKVENTQKMVPKVILNDKILM